MSKALERTNLFIGIGYTFEQAIESVKMLQLERIADATEKIADALEKQNASKDEKFIPFDSNGPCEPGISRICSP